MNNVFGVSKIGLVRQQNEDRFFIDPNICVVTDGMGGYIGGEIASTYAVDEIKGYLEKMSSITEQSLIEAILQANQKIIKRIAHEERLSGMGTTAVVAAAVEDTLFWASVGDSRLYIYCGNVLTQITKDHSVVQELLDTGNITPEEVMTHPQRNLITRAIGTTEILAVDSGSLSIVPGSRILLCTDGLTSYISDDTIRDILRSTDSNEEAVQQMIDAVYEAGAGDNVTIILGTL